jgi:hypothetical protein
MTEGWDNDAYKTITILEEPTDPTFITWLKANATKVGDTPDEGYYLEDNEFGGQTLYITDPNAVLTLVDNEFGGQTAIIN